MALKVLVTGADGFIGSHLTEQLLNKGYSVTALAQYNSFNSAGWLGEIGSNSQDKLNIVLGDIRDPNQMRELVKGHHAVFHLAALIAIPYSYTSVDSYFETNVKGTLNLLEASRLNQVQKFIHTSTSEVYGTAKFVPITELHPINPQSPYAASKVSSDALVNSYFCSYGFPAITIRPFNTYGPRQSQRAIIPTIISQLLSSKSTVSLGALTPTRDLTYVSDTCEGFIAALEAEDKSAFGQVFNLGTGFEINIGQLFSEICEITGIRKELEISEERLRPAESEVERLLSDNSLAREILNWSPKFENLEGLQTGIGLTRDWIKSSDFSNSSGIFIK
jgi:dTDP-glucose 4,6-dehydratase/UDP-glucose 4-epimerase